MLIMKICVFIIIFLFLCSPDGICWECEGPSGIHQGFCPVRSFGSRSQGRSCCVFCSGHLPVLAGKRFTESHSLHSEADSLLWPYSSSSHSFCDVRLSQHTFLGSEERFRASQDVRLSHPRECSRPRPLLHRCRLFPVNHSSDLPS